MENASRHAVRDRMHEIIFEADTFGGRLFDIVLIISIVTSVGVVMLDSMEAVRASHGPFLRTLEWFFTILFTVEYLLRLYCVRNPRKYASSFYGIVDLLCVIPTYLSSHSRQPLPARYPRPARPARVPGTEARALSQRS